MDYTPISARRVLVAFALTMFVALLPALIFALRKGSDGLLLVAGSVTLAAVVGGACALVVSLGRRLLRRPARA